MGKKLSVFIDNFLDLLSPREGKYDKIQVVFGLVTSAF